MMEIAIEQVLLWDCGKEYDTVGKIIALTDDDWPKTPFEIARLGIPAEDRIRILLKSGIVPKKQLRLLACNFAERTLLHFEAEYPDDKRPREAIETRRRWVNGEATDEELATVRVAVGDAAMVTPKAAAGDAVRAAILDADGHTPRAAVWHTARVAAMDAAMAVGRPAAGDVERQYQLEMIMNAVSTV